MVYACIKKQATIISILLACNNFSSRAKNQYTIMEITTKFLIPLVTNLKGHKTKLKMIINIICKLLKLLFFNTLVIDSSPR